MNQTSKPAEATSTGASSIEEIFDQAVANSEEGEEFTGVTLEEEVYDFPTLNGSIKREDNILFLLLNIRSMKSNFELLETFIESMTVRPDVIVCSESWYLPHT